MNNRLAAWVLLGFALSPARAVADACSIPIDLEFEREGIELRSIDETALARALNRAQHWPNRSGLRIAFAAYAPASEASAVPQQLQLIHGREASIRKWFLAHGLEESSLHVSAQHELSVAGAGVPHGTAEVEISFSCSAR